MILVPADFGQRHTARPRVRPQPPAPAFVNDEARRSGGASHDPRTVPAFRRRLHPGRLSTPGEQRRFVRGLRLRAPAGAPPAIRRRSSGTRRPTSARPSGRPAYRPPRSPPPATRAGQHDRRGGDPHPHRVAVRWRCRHLPHAAARRHSLRARSRLQLVALRTCLKQNLLRLRCGALFCPPLTSGGRGRASANRAYTDRAVTPPASRRPTLRPPCPPSLPRMPYGSVPGASCWPLLEVVPVIHRRRSPHPTLSRLARLEPLLVARVSDGRMPADVHGLANVSRARPLSVRRYFCRRR